MKARTIVLATVIFFWCCTRNEQAANEKPAFKFTSTPWLGVEVEHEGALVVKNVLANSPAAAAGIQPGDVLTVFDGTEVTDLAGIHKAIQELGAFRKTVVTLRRDTESFNVSLRPLVLGLLDDNVYSMQEGFCDGNCNCRYDTLGQCVSVYRYMGPDSRGGSSFIKYCADSRKELTECYRVILL